MAVSDKVVSNTHTRHLHLINSEENEVYNSCVGYLKHPDWTSFSKCMFHCGPTDARM